MDANGKTMRQMNLCRRAVSRIVLGSCHGELSVLLYKQTSVTFDGLLFVSSNRNWVSLKFIKMREILHLQAGQCGNQIGAKVRYFCTIKPLFFLFILIHIYLSYILCVRKLSQL